MKKKKRWREIQRESGRQIQKRETTPERERE